MDQSQSRLKLRISRMFRSSFGSCRSRNVSDVIAAPQPPENQTGHRNSFHFPVTGEPQLKSPKARNFPAICKPRCPESAQPIVNHSCIRVSKEALRRRKVCVSGDGAGRRDFSPLDDFYDFYGTTHKKKGKKKKNRSKPRARRSGNSMKLEAFPFGSASKDSYSVRNSWWFSSDEDETDALFSSRSLSSDSSESLGRRKVGSSGRRTVRDSLAVVKRSSDPYSDFRTSMVEMIVEKQIFGTKDLEELLQCFLSLNSHEHHNMILEVFTEIWEALFCDWT